jgi:radical SAM superfamily enzyme YgiQ (UPF0313 family)
MCRSSTSTTGRILVLIQAYITNAYRAYRIADHYRARGAFVAMGGLHVTSPPDEAAAHADAVFLGPAEQTFPQFLAEFRAGRPRGGVPVVFRTEARPPAPGAPRSDRPLSLLGAELHPW